MNKILLNKENTTRFSSAPWFEKIQLQKVSLVGAGGIGSYLAFNLARLDINMLEIFDGDTVEEINMAGQLFKVTDIHKNKASVLQDLVAEYCLFQKCNCYGFFSEEYGLYPITFTALDNMAARKLSYDKWKLRVTSPDFNINTPAIFIDGRLAAEDYQILAIQGHDLEAMKYYEENWLFSDEEADATLCSYKQTSFIASQIAASMTNIFVNYIYNHTFNTPIRSVPVYTEYCGDTMELTLKENKISFPALSTIASESVTPSTTRRRTRRTTLPEPSTAPIELEVEIPNFIESNMGIIEEELLGVDRIREWYDNLPNEEVDLLSYANTTNPEINIESLTAYFYSNGNPIAITEANIAIAIFQLTPHPDGNEDI